jgi:hypothetical protein
LVLRTFTLHLRLTRNKNIQFSKNHIFEIQNYEKSVFWVYFSDKTSNLAGISIYRFSTLIYIIVVRNLVGRASVAENSVGCVMVVVCHSGSLYPTLNFFHGMPKMEIVMNSNFDFCRWGSTYVMIGCLLKLESLCRDAVEHGNRELLLSDNQWLGLHEIEETLKPAYIATKNLQARQLTLPDVRKVIDIAHSHTSQLGIYIYIYVNWIVKFNLL